MPRHQQRGLNELIASVKIKMEQIAGLEAERDAEIRRSGHAHFAEEQAKQRQNKADAEAKLAKVQAQRPNTQLKQEQATTAYSEVVSRMRRCEEEAIAAQETLRRSEQIVKDIKDVQAKGATEQYARYGKKIDMVWAEIRNHRWHRGFPLGPLGVHVKVKKGQEQYTKVVTTAIGVHLISWAVQDSRDRAQLMSIFKRCQDRGA